MGQHDPTSNRLAEAAASLDSSGQALGRRSTTPGALEQIVDLALSTLDSAQHAGVTLVVGEGFVTVAASDDLPEKVDQAQYRFAEGPCVDAAVCDTVFRGDDLAHDPRWPRFAPHAVSLGVRSMLAVPLFEDERRNGALNLYASRPDAFDDDDEAVAVIFAAQASLALARARDHDSTVLLEAALDNSRVISTAVGILMGSKGLTNDEAIALLRRASQRLNRKVSDLAETVAYTGELPP